MWTKYSLKEAKEDCLINFKLPSELFEALSARAKVLGRGFETELRLRLVRSLLRDDFRDRSDKLLEAIYYSEES